MASNIMPRDLTVASVLGHRGLQSGAHLRALTGIRCAAAYWVVAFHYRTELYAVSPLVHVFAPVIDLGYQAVPLFFILSGFILSHTYGARYHAGTHAEFVYLRIARLLPVHAITLGTLVAYVVFLDIHRGFHVDSEAYAYRDVPLELLMIRNWFTDVHAWNFPAWSIHAELFAYMFIFPVGLWATRRMQSALLAAATVVVMLVAGTIGAIQSLPGVVPDIIFFFSAGLALYRLRGLTRIAVGARLSYLAVALFIVAVLVPAAIAPLLMYLSFAVLIFALSYSDGHVSRILGSRAAVYGGTISYSLYTKSYTNCCKCRLGCGLHQAKQVV